MCDSKKKNRPPELIHFRVDGERYQLEDPGDAHHEHQLDVQQTLEPQHSQFAARVIAILVPQSPAGQPEIDNVQHQQDGDRPVKIRPRLHSACTIVIFYSGRFAREDDEPTDGSFARSFSFDLRSRLNWIDERETREIIYWVGN